jgi:hypothetical protein
LEIILQIDRGLAETWREIHALCVKIYQPREIGLEGETEISRRTVRHVSC